MSMMWVGIGSTVIGAGTALYGAKKSSQANDKAIAAQKEAAAAADKATYQRWLESQGVGANGEKLNVWLPRYKMMNSNWGRTPRFRRRAPSVNPQLGAPSSMYAAAPRSFTPGSYSSSPAPDQGYYTVSGFGNEAHNPYV